MRAGPLSNAAVIEQLQLDFVSTWVLAKHLPAIADGAEDPFVRALAREAHENYLYPVDSQVFSSAGELLHHICANDKDRQLPAHYLELLAAAKQED